MSCDNARNDSCTSKFRLEMDILVLQQQLQEEMELRSILENALEGNGTESTSLPSLPTQAEELLSDISMLEVTVAKLELQTVSLHYQISQERNERRLAEYHTRHSSSPWQGGIVSLDANVLDNKASVDMDAKTYQPVWSVWIERNGEKRREGKGCFSPFLSFGKN